MGGEEPGGAAAKLMGSAEEAGLGPGSRGYRLLRRAGWRAGAGLGAAEQGPTEPLAARGNAGRRGLGAGPAPGAGGGGEADVAAATAAAPAEEAPRRRGGGRKRRRRAGGETDAAGGEREPEGGGLPIERETRKEKQIATYLFRAFKEEEPEPGGERHSNPLLRKGWRSGTNPLDLGDGGAG